MLKLFLDAGWVAWPLGLMSVLAVAIILERIYTLAQLRRAEERATMILQLALEKGDDAMLRDPNVAAAPVTQVIEALTSMRGASEETLQRAAEIAISMQRVRLKRYLGTLATISSTAPFVGLFGTVIGILLAFEGMAGQGSAQGSERLAAGISEALSATALGLLVAIPAVMAYNYFLGRVNVFALEVQGHVARLAPLLARKPEASRVERESSERVTA